MGLIDDDQKDRPGEVSNAMNLLLLIKEMVYFLYWGLMLFASPPFFFLISHLLLLFNCYPSMSTLIHFYSRKQEKKKSRTLLFLVPIDFSICMYEHMCRTIDDEIIDIIFCHMIRSTDAEVIHKTNMFIKSTCVYINNYIDEIIYVFFSMFQIRFDQKIHFNQAPIIKK